MENKSKCNKEKKELTQKERKMIDDYLAVHTVTECEPDKTSYEIIDLYESLILEPFKPELINSKQ